MLVKFQYALQVLNSKSFFSMTEHDSWSTIYGFISGQQRHACHSAHICLHNALSLRTLVTPQSAPTHWWASYYPSWSFNLTPRPMTAANLTHCWYIFTLALTQHLLALRTPWPILPLPSCVVMIIRGLLGSVPPGILRRCMDNYVLVWSSIVRLLWNHSPIVGGLRFSMETRGTGSRTCLVSCRFSQVLRILDSSFSTFIWSQGLIEAAYADHV